MRYLPLLLICLVSCGGTLQTGVVYQTPNGHTVTHLKDADIPEVDLEGIDTMINLTITEFEKTSGEVILETPSLIIILADGSIDCPTDEKPWRTCRGIYRGHSIMEVVWNNYGFYPFCASYTALAHETVHWLGDVKLGDAMGEHPEEYFYRDSVTMRANQTYYYSYCRGR